MTTAIGTYATTVLLKSNLGITDATDDTILGTVCDRINQYIETKTGRVFAPISSAVIKFDGDGTNCLRYPKGIRAVTLLEIAPYTGADYETIAAGDYFLRPSPADLRPGWPYTRIYLSNHHAGPYGAFPRGFDTVQVTATTGWTAIPDDITELALTAATRAWHAIKSGQGDLVGTDDMGQVLVSRFFSARDLETLRLYGVDIP